MAPITDNELSSLESMFRAEQRLLQEYAQYARLCEDPQLKTKFQETAALHRAHCLTLAKLLDGEGTAP